MASTLLTDALEATVPWWIEQLRGTSFGYRQGMARESVDIIGSQGDNILFRASKPGETARAFNALARGLAILALQPGGVTALGLSFCATHPRTHWTAPGPCPDCVAEESGRPAEAAPAAEPARPRVTTIQPAGGVL